MFDIRWIRDNPDLFDVGLARRGLSPQAERLLGLDHHRRDALARAQDIQTERNKAAKQIGAAKSRGEDAAELIATVARSKDEQAALETAAGAAERDLDAALEQLPNLPASDVPDGADEADNVELRLQGTLPVLADPVRDHVALGEMLGGMDFQRAAKLSGARFVVLTGALARLERALGAFMLDLHTQEFGYTEVRPPALVRDAALYGTGQLPKFADDLFRTEGGLWLIPTAEVPLTNLVADEILDVETLPRRYTALTECYRSEAGAAGKDTHGMIRQHQFTKVEMVSITAPEDSDDELERMTSCAEAVLTRLEIPYRVMALCTGDLGFAARKTYDIEVWLPGQNRYREISSCSSCGDFQARRMRTRLRAPGEKGTRFVHTLNGSGVAVGRALVALLENNQLPDGRVAVPAALRPYLGGQDVIGPS